MRHNLRLALTVLLTLTLSLSMFADVRLVKRCHMSVGDGVLATADGKVKNCCDPARAGEFTQKGHFCKTGQECSAPVCAPIASVVLLPQVFADGPAVIGRIFPFVASHFVDDLWRPPRHLS